MPSLTFPLCSGGGQAAARETSLGHSGCTILQVVQNTHDFTESKSCSV